MDLDKRSCHFIVTVPADAKPCEGDIPHVNASVVIGKWSEANKSLSVWYSWTNAQRASTIANAWQSDRIIIKHSKLEHKSSFMDLTYDWLYQPKIDNTITLIDERKAIAVAIDKPYEEGAAVLPPKECHSIVSNLRALKRKRDEIDQELDIVKNNLKVYIAELMQSALD
jgi:hypothetical protein